MDVRQDTTASDRGLNELIELVVSTNSQQQVTRVDTLHVHILSGVTSKLEQLGSQVLKDGGAVHGCSGSNATSSVRALLQETVDTSDGELIIANKPSVNVQRRKMNRQPRHRENAERTQRECANEAEARNSTTSQFQYTIRVKKAQKQSVTCQGNHRHHPMRGKRARIRPGGRVEEVFELPKTCSCSKGRKVSERT